MVKKAFIYVINTAEFEDMGCRQYFYKFLVGFKQKILKSGMKGKFIIWPLEKSRNSKRNF